MFVKMLCSCWAKSANYINYVILRTNESQILRFSLFQWMTLINICQKQKFKSPFVSTLSRSHQFVATKNWQQIAHNAVILMKFSEKL